MKMQALSSEWTYLLAFGRADEPSSISDLIWLGMTTCRFGGSSSVFLKSKRLMSCSYILLFQSKEICATLGQKWVKVVGWGGGFS
jgi:hypothetical protein